MAIDDRQRVIGKVVAVAADRLTIELHRGTSNFTVVGYDDIHYVAQLGSYIVIPVGIDYMVAEVVGLRERDSSAGNQAYPSAEGVYKTNSAKYLDVVPIGMLPKRTDTGFRFGVSAYPSLYADALYVLDSELDRIFEVDASVEELEPNDAGNELTRYGALTIGTSMVFSDYSVKVRLDEFFGSHTAVLGNTGSGKSCTVASVVQSLFEKPDSLFALGASFVIFDVNGEYRRAFSELPVHIHRQFIMHAENPDSAQPEALDESEETGLLKIPHWFMTAEEWELLLRASERTQQPVLRSALGLATLFGQGGGAPDDLKNHVLAACIDHVMSSDAGTPSKRDRIIAIVSRFQTPEINREAIAPFIEVNYGQFENPDGLLNLVNKHVINDFEIPAYAGLPFEFGLLIPALDLALLYEEANGNRQIRDYCAQLVVRLKWISHRVEYAFLRCAPDECEEYGHDPHLFVESLLGLARKDGKIFKESQLTLIDMSEAEDEIVEVASAVISRLIFDRLRRAEPRARAPVNLVLEEAHRYISERKTVRAIEANRIFERIAKEGRKYGMYLVLASQRPSELSRTVLSQCSNFVVHRIQNPEDLSHIRQMTPFISDSVLRRLPSLPKQHALIFGNSVNLPMTFRVRDVSPRPESDDAPIREIWFRSKDDSLELRIGPPHQG